MTIRFNHVSKQFGTVTAIYSLDLVLPESGIVAIMGPSGCGKTTLLQLLAGLQSPDSGTLHNPYTHISYVFQEPRLLPWRTVEANILLACHQNPASMPPSARSARKWLDAVGLHDCADRYPEMLSGGMRQRVALARALCNNGDLLLLDEPFQGLDEQNKEHILSLLRQERSVQGKLTVLVTHDREEASAIADKRIVFEGAPASRYHWE